MELDAVQEAAQAQFARQSHRYATGHILEDTTDVVAALEGIPIPAAAHVLDVATGAGHTGLCLAAMGHRVTLADIAAPMLQRALELAAKRGLRVETRQHAAENLPYPDGSFDLLTSRVAPHHFSSPERFVQETSRVLARGGHFMLIDGTVADGHSEAEAWLHQVEKLRDPSHHRFLTPDTWSKLCAQNGLTVIRRTLTPFKQPDLQWYFETAATSAENRAEVLDLVRCAPQSARDLFQLREEDGRIVWWWQRLTLVVAKS